MFWKNGLTRVISPRPDKPGDEESFTLRTHRVFVLTVMVLSLVAGTLQYFGTPINCWTPAQFTQAMKDYAESRCYFTSTYNIPDNTEYMPVWDRQEPFVNYYKLTPFVLAFLAVLYFVPEIIMNFAGKIAFLNFSSLLEIARQSHKGSGESRKAAIGQLVVDLQHRLTPKVTRHKRTDFRRYIDKMMPSLPFYLHLQQISSKLVFALGAILPLIFFRNYLHVNFQFKDQVITKGSALSKQILFPKTIFCDFEVRVLQNLHPYTVQCDLPANDMFEKISLLVCFLALVVCTISISDVIGCLIFPLFSPWDYSYTKRHMTMFTDVNSGYDKELLRNFVERYLNSDVIYLLQLIGQNSSDHVVCQILAKLWEGYAESLYDDTALMTSSEEAGKTF